MGGAEYQGSRPIDGSQNLGARGVINLSKDLRAYFGTAAELLTNPGSKKFLHLIAATGDVIAIRPGKYLARTFVDADIAVDADSSRDADENTIDDEDHGFVSGDGPYQITTDGVQPTGIDLLTGYYIEFIDDDTYALHTSPENAKDAEALGNTGANRVVITSAATGDTETIAAMPALALDVAASLTSGYLSYTLTGVTAGKEDTQAGVVISAPEYLTVQGQAASDVLVYWWT